MMIASTAADLEKDERNAKQPSALGVKARKMPSFLARPAWPWHGSVLFWARASQRLG